VCRMRFSEVLTRRIRARPIPTMIRRVRIAVSENYWDHYFEQYYRGYRIDLFPGPGGLYGIYMGPEDPETIPKSPPDPNFDYNDWAFYGTLEAARGAIDSWVEEPIFVQHHPNVTWETHVDPGWDI
ncbi:unnamed protein product, partial [marine sediment metagenome]